MCRELQIIVVADLQSHGICSAKTQAPKGNVQVHAAVRDDGLQSLEAGDFGPECGRTSQSSPPYEMSFIVHLYRG